ncbi:MAG: ATP-binding cassette domain-containing protein, partial [Bacteroidota bacterium]
VIRNLDLTIESGSTHGLVGLNGSGKTTLITGLCGLKSLANGKIQFNNSALVKKDVAYLETNNFFYSNITGREYLELFTYYHPDFAIEEWNQLFDLPLDQYTESYSTGMKKKLAFMGVIALDRAILVLDEPFNGIDLETTQKLKTIIKTLKEQGKTILLTSHIIESLTSLCTAISYLADGQIQYTFQPLEYAGMEEQLFGSSQEKNAALVRKLLK